MSGEANTWAQYACSDGGEGARRRMLSHPQLWAADYSEAAEPPKSRREAEVI